MNWAFWIIDLDNLGSEVCQNSATCRASEDDTEVNYLEAVQRELGIYLRSSDFGG
jgi:hypothetical protein